MTTGEEDIVAWFRRRRKLHGRSREDAAAALGFDVATIGAWERGERTPDGRTLGAMVELSCLWDECVPASRMPPEMPADRWSAWLLELVRLSGVPRSRLSLLIGWSVSALSRWARGSTPMPRSAQVALWGACLDSPALSGPARRAMLAVAED